MRINGDDIVTEEIEWGILWGDDGAVTLVDDEEEARAAMALCVNASVVARKIYATDWADA